MQLDTFIRRQLDLLELEREAEIEEVERLRSELSDAELERRGLTLRRLTLRDTDVGLGGRSLLVLEPSRGGELPAHRFASGDLVALREGRDDEAARIGVVDSVRRDTIRITVEEGEDDPELPNLIRLDRLVPDITFRRMRDAIKALGAKPVPEHRTLRRTALGEVEPGSLRPSLKTAVGHHLDASQREAVAAALEADPIALIHGPPGTGKTTAVVELIRLAVLRGERVLAAAPSNVAVDNLAERLAAAGVRVVRVGHPARLLPQVRALSLDAQVADVLTYVFGSWKNPGGGFDAAEVAAVRATTGFKTFAELQAANSYAPLPEAPRGFRLREVIRLTDFAVRIASDGSGRRLYLLGGGGDVWSLEPATRKLTNLFRGTDYLDPALGSPST
ncbi:MAG: AAA domain-containing protein, partial [Planctomycetota bacterium]